MADMKTTPVAMVFCERLLGPVGLILASGAVMCSTFGALNGNLLVAPRQWYAMGEDGMAPRILAAIHSSYRTPAVAILAMAAWASILILAVAGLSEAGYLEPGEVSFNILTGYAMFGANVFETLALATIFVFRWQRPDADRPYRCWGYPWVPALYVAILAAVLANMFWKKTIVSLTGVGFITVGAAVFYLAGYGSITADIQWLAAAVSRRNAGPENEKTEER
jgi:amino acid transporter